MGCIFIYTIICGDKFCFIKKWKKISMSQGMLYIMAAFSIIDAIDWLTGNKLKKVFCLEVNLHLCQAYQRKLFFHFLQANLLEK